MKINGIKIDISKLISKDELLKELADGSASDSDLSDIRGRYFEEFGNELIWRYPISDGVNAGTVIVAVKEGFLSLPYNEMESLEYEIFELERANLLDENELKQFISEWKIFSDDLLSALGDMLGIGRNIMNDFTNRVEDMKRYNPEKEIFIVWSVIDIQSIRPDLSDEQANMVLDEIKRKHDADMGISWTTLKIYADEMYPK